ncbi:MAG: hypothetical protein IKA76_09385, partial [Clostridia bacterium]|nr:hypothetical protein [Clostridia bacterium]
MRSKAEKSGEQRSRPYVPRWATVALIGAWLLFVCSVIGVILWRTLGASDSENPDGTPERSRIFLEGETVDLSDPSYTYEEMVDDLRELCRLYPDRIRVASAGTSADGREILYADLGRSDAPRQFFVSAGIHGRETVPPLIAMNMVEFYLLNYDVEDENGKAIADFAKDCMIRVLPMINPDGITLATEGLEAIRSEALREQVRSIYETDRSEYASYGQYGSLEEYLKYWKANLNGVDLNRNFPIDAWSEVSTGIPQPSSQKYKGREG